MQNHKVTIFLAGLSLVILVLGSLASITITRKRFLEEFNHMNGYYKQTLFLTGQSKREEAKEQYDMWSTSFSEFNQKYSSYRPFVIRNDAEFDSDLTQVGEIIAAAKTGVYSGDLPATHKQLETVRPIFQDMFKRNNFSMLSMALVDFHDLMEKLIDAADAKDSQALLNAYPEADASLTAIEKEDNSVEVQKIRKNLSDLKSLADTNKVDELSGKAAELKASFIKIYLIKG